MSIFSGNMLGCVYVEYWKRGKHSFATSWKQAIKRGKKWVQEEKSESRRRYLKCRLRAGDYDIDERVK